jgi:hypothetical protein
MMVYEIGPSVRAKVKEMMTPRMACANCAEDEVEVAATIPSAKRKVMFAAVPHRYMVRRPNQLLRSHEQPTATHCRHEVMSPKAKEKLLVIPASAGYQPCGQYDVDPQLRAQ